MRGRRLLLLALLAAACGCADARDASLEASASLEQPSGAARASSGQPERFAPIDFRARSHQTVGFDSVLLAETFARAAALPRLHSLLVARDGEVAREAYFRGAGRGVPTNVKSVSKSVLSALVGIAIQEGKLDGVDQPVASFFAAHLERDSQRVAKQRITVGHLLSMQSGLESTSFYNYGRWVGSPNWVRFAITRPLVDQPGGRMLYSTGSAHLLSAILTQAARTSTYAYARDKLFRPLGTDLRHWPTDPQGIYFGGNDMRLTPRDLWRLGELYRGGGVWNGRRILSEEWIRASWTPRTTSPWNGHRYGYGWWMKQARGHAVYFAWGYGGQFMFVVPDLAVVAVATSDAGAETRDGGHLRAVHALLDDGIIPAAERPDQFSFSSFGRGSYAAAISGPANARAVGEPLRP